MAVRVHCLALGGVDLTSSAGKMTMGVIAAVAQFERDLLIERTLSGQARAKAEGKKFGRPAALSDKQREETLQRLADEHRDQRGGAGDEGQQGYYHAGWLGCRGGAASLIASLGVAAVLALSATPTTGPTRVAGSAPYERILNMLRSKFCAGSLSHGNARRFGIE